jgi:hypothetical protein
MALFGEKKEKNYCECTPSLINGNMNKYPNLSLFIVNFNSDFYYITWT